MDRDAIQSRCEARFRDTGNEVISDANWVDYINETYRDIIAGEDYWPFLRKKSTSFTYTAEAESVALPEDSFRVSSVHNATDDWPLVPLEGGTTHIEVYPQADEVFGDPTSYRIYGRNIELYPRPNAAITLWIEYTATPAELTAGTSTPVFPAQYHNLLVYGALAKAYEDDANPAAADMYWRHYDHYLDRMKDDLLSTQTDRYPSIRDTWDTSYDY